MRLIDTTTLAMHEFPDSYQRYAILSHTWLQPGEEVTCSEMMMLPRPNTILFKPGYLKIVQTCRIAKETYDLPYAWVDTCCIDKTSSAELSEAINSMYKWYKDAWVCLAYLSDLEPGLAGLKECRWWSRAWTLQELIAPKHVIFLDKNWEYCGTKETMNAQILEVTGIPTDVLDQTKDLDMIPVAQRFSWASNRSATRVEDKAYSLLGIFDINMPMLYGEGPKAFIRLQEHILSQYADLSLFLWRDNRSTGHLVGLLARSPQAFAGMGQVKARPFFRGHEFQLTNRGIRFTSDLGWDTHGKAILPLYHSFAPSEKHMGICLLRAGPDGFVRVEPAGFSEVPTHQVQTVFTILKSLTMTQEHFMTTNPLRVQVEDTISVVAIEPYQMPHKANGVRFLRLYTNPKGTYFGYIILEKPNYSPFVIFFCCRDGMWSADVERIHENLSRAVPAEQISFVHESSSNTAPERQTVSKAFRDLSRETAGSLKFDLRTTIKLACFENTEVTERIVVKSGYFLARCVITTEQLD